MLGHKLTCVSCEQSESTSKCSSEHAYVLDNASNNCAPWRVWLQFRHSQLANGLDSLVCRIIQVICRNDGVLTSLQNLLALLNICTFQSYNQGNLQTNLHTPKNTFMYEQTMMMACCSGKLSSVLGHHIQAVYTNAFLLCIY